MSHTEDDLGKLLTFIKLSLRIIQTYPDTALKINTVLMPYAQGPLSSCFLRHSNFTDFNKETLSLFVPTKS